ncbi:hypothetical protein GCM10009742_07250 [Kribbella karoonensis]|uniref:ClpX-type ZB domain-containing protein n=1 Tax=Kribbella karoonensis TaxID=324851 RepID=A0ABN2D127_9ACTN
MTEQAETVRAVTPRCWCCGGEFAERELVRLGSHPEVGVCLRCVRFLQRRAAERYDAQQPSAGRWLRVGVRRARAWFVARGWHQLPLAGWILRRIDRHLP